MTPVMRLILVLVLQLASRNRSGNGSQKAVVAHPIPCKMSGQASDDGAT